MGGERSTNDDEETSTDDEETSTDDNEETPTNDGDATGDADAMADSTETADPTAGLSDELLATLTDAPREALSEPDATLYDELVDGDQRALARVLTRIENRADGARELLAALHSHAETTPVLGITGSPGAANPRSSTSSPTTIGSAARRSACWRSIPPRRTPAARCWATGFGWGRPPATRACSSGR